MNIVLRTFEQIVALDRDHHCDGVGRDHICVRVAATARLPTRFGEYQAVAFWNPEDGKEHAAFVHGGHVPGDDVPVRLHSECLTGDAIGSLRCDCRDQLETSLRQLARMPHGILLYLRQEGRGIGLVNKVRAYALQDQGLDTVDANLALGFRDDERDYAIAAHMLESLGVRSVRLMTNNPRKIAGLEANGVRVTGRLPLVIPANNYNRSYLRTKAERSGHLFQVDGFERMEEQMDRPIVRGMSPDAVAEATGEQHGAL